MDLKEDAMSDWWKFFKDFEDHRVKARFYENERSFSLEELYQAFKAREKEERAPEVE